MDTATLHSIWTVLLFALFIGICVWAWSSRRTTDFERAAQLPFDDDATTTQSARSGEK